MKSFARLALAFSTIVVAGCGKSSSSVEPPAVSNSVVMTRAGGSAVSFGSTVRAWCGPWDAIDIAEPAIHVIVGNVAAAHWELHAVRKDIRIGEELTFPNAFEWDEPRGAEIFVHDPPNDLSTQTIGSSGGVVFEQLDCGSGGTVRFRVDAVIGSEFVDMDPVTAVGTLSAPLTAPPAS